MSAHLNFGERLMAFVNDYSLDLLFFFFLFVLVVSL